MSTLAKAADCLYLILLIYNPLCRAHLHRIVAIWAVYTNLIRLSISLIRTRNLSPLAGSILKLIVAIGILKHIFFKLYRYSISILYYIIISPLYGFNRLFTPLNNTLYSSKLSTLLDICRVVILYLRQISIHHIEVVNL